MNATIITTDKAKLQMADEFTAAHLTVRMADGSYAFSDGLGRYYRSVKLMIPGYDYVYGTATATAEHDDAHEALGDAYRPQGSKLVYFDEVK